MSIYLMTPKHPPPSTPPWPDFYTLPSSPSVTSQDRFGLLDADTLDVPFWSVFSALLSPPVPSIPAFLDILETIAVELRGTSPLDYATLSSFLHAHESEFLSTWPRIAALALNMPRFFPSHRLPILQPGRSAKLQLSRAQTACLVAHQLLGTLAPPVWQAGFQNFDIWFQGAQPHARAPSLYLSAVLTYFSRLGPAGAASAADEVDQLEKVLPEWPITYELVSQPVVPQHTTALPLPLPLPHPETPPSDIALLPLTPATNTPPFLGAHPATAAVISANKFIGFGRSATQEEVLVGTAPAACPAVLVTPPLGVAQALVVRGCEAVLRTAGQGRGIQGCGVHAGPWGEGGVAAYAERWRERTMLFMDALELDECDAGAYPDVERVNVERELVKAVVGFGSGRYARIYTGLWGCRTFGGDPGVKMVILWVAASVKEAALTVTYEEGREEFVGKMGQFIELVREKGWKLGDIWSLLWDAEGKGIEKGGFLDWVLAKG